MPSVILMKTEVVAALSLPLSISVLFTFFARS